ncbi:Gfo/Idh/MocA family oxidoreductase [Diaminobutyricibacter tongyongensis]|uniref:Gfo/Idh/MocA family oxidoreductase n=1 Tax=Leifsonia tongyongensis TaxID=1268043 RepID=A0A6L9Y0X2_9MICO|nr:Gfo/Idh/MocA family oxidoreductase [Diaminobutyricibacter tongyongensis]NEN07175.1 Gfo/Idh/MocA family oxidoreductase [Diaminobutyricibacter tongyongensis]
MSDAATGRSVLSVAIVGCGIIGLNHARAIARHPRLTITALVDAVPAAATMLADQVESELGIARPAEHVSLTAALAASPIDLVVVCTPSGLHVPLAEEALLAGKHVVIEKPLDVSMERAREIAGLAAAAATRGLVVSVISQHRFDPSSVAVARAVRDGRFGRVTSGIASVAWWRSQDYYDSGQWRGTWEFDGGGAVMNQGVHTVDLLVWFLGRPVDVYAHTALLAHDRVEVEDVAVATVRFESGALGVIHATTAAYPGLSVRVQVHGDRGSAIIDDDQLEYFYAAGDDAFDPGGSSARNQAAELVPADELRGGDRGPDVFITGHLRQYEDVVDAIVEGREPGVRVEDALLSLAVVRAVYLSATLGRSVAVDEVLSGSLDGISVVTGTVA